MSSKFWAFWALLIVSFTLPVRAQRGNPPSGSRSDPTSPPRQPTIRPSDAQPELTVPSIQIPKTVVEDEKCLPWDLSDVRGATVSPARLAVPSKARSEYEKACGDFRNKKLPDAEQHLRDAIQKYSNYSAAWVMLGQVLQDEQKMSEAHEACSQAIKVDPSYLPPYLCQAGLLNRENQWADLLTFSGQFLGMNPTGDRYANYYRGIAYFQVHNLPDAQKSVSEAIAIDTEHRQPELYFLLAQIYAEQDHVDDAILQVQLFLKYNNGRMDPGIANQYLAKLQSQQNNK